MLAEYKESTSLDFKILGNILLRKMMIFVFRKRPSNLNKVSKSEFLRTDDRYHAKLRQILHMNKWAFQFVIHSNERLFCKDRPLESNNL